MSADINVGAITEALNNKVDLVMGVPQDAVDYVVAMQRPTADNNYTWYRKYKSGWVEQGGYGESSATTLVVSLPITMANTDYSAMATPAANATSNNPRMFVLKSNLTTTSCTISFASYNSGQYKAFWQVSGMAA